MSGLGAVVCWSGAADDERARKVADAVAVRGPDGARLLTVDGAILVHALFATTPEAWREHQPVAHATRRWWLTADARIDNGAELRALLDAHVVHPLDTDADLVLAAYEMWGDQFAGHLLGDFAVAIWDAERRVVVLARDHFGVRPLYWARDVDGGVVVASTLRAAAHASGLALVPDEVFLADYAMFTGRDGVHSPWRGIGRVAPATTLTISENSQISAVYWDGVVAYRDCTADEAAVTVRRLFRLAVRARLRGDGPFGVELSGGYDSTTAAAVAAAVAGPSHVRGYSSTFPGMACDESAFIDAAQQHIGIQVVRLDAPAQPAYEFADDCRRTWDMPLLPDNRWYTPMLRHAAADGCRVVLTGQGGDHVLAGGELLHARDLVDQWHLLQAWRSARDDVAEPTRVWAKMVVRRLVRPVTTARVRRWARALLRRRRHSGAVYGLELLSPTVGAALPVAVALPRQSGIAARSRTIRRAGFDLGLTQFLEIIDRCNSDVSVECSHPFLDVRLVDYIMSLPADLFMTDGSDRSLHRRAFAELLPPKLLRRTSKADFALPWNQSAAHALAQLDQAVAEGTHRGRQPLGDEQLLREVAAEIATDPETERASWQWWGVMAISLWRSACDSAIIPPAEC